MSGSSMATQGSGHGTHIHRLKPEELWMSSLKNKRILVTGGGGFLGSHVVEQLKDRGCADVYAVRSRDYDLVTERDTIRLFEEHPADVVFHLAGLVVGIGANRKSPGDYFYHNLMLGAHVLHYAYKTGA